MMKTSILFPSDVTNRLLKPVGVLIALHLNSKVHLQDRPGRDTVV